MEFYNNLQRELDREREENDRTIIMGNWNSRVGKDHNKRLEYGMWAPIKYGDMKNGRFLEKKPRNNRKCHGEDKAHVEDKYNYVTEEWNAKRLVDYIICTQSLRDISKFEVKKEA